MAKKPCSRGQKETGNNGRKQEPLFNEITLRDEILDLKRQVMILKRTNEQYSVRLRKYEDEAKKKEKQFEQLMNPRKNANITKVLSTKGATILMNLKDQNNALIHMLLNKDLQIRRLVAEVKMSKLYASTKRNECYKTEISRLRNLLIKSEEMLRENTEMQQEQTRSICVGGNPISDFSSSSDQSSSADLDELRCTILSLESHIKYSNNLLAQKNQEISQLHNELNVLREHLRYKVSKLEVFNCDNSTAIQLPPKTCEESWTNPFNSPKLSSQNLLNFFEKRSSNRYDQLFDLPPADSTILAPSYSSTPEHRLPLTISKNYETHTTAAMVTREDVEYSATSAIDLETEEIEIIEKDIQRGEGTTSSTNEEKTSEFIGKLISEDSKKTKGLRSIIKNSDNDVTLHLCQTIQNSSISNKSGKSSGSELAPSNESEHPNTYLNMGLKGSHHAQKELKISLQNDLEELKPKERKSLREVYCQSLDSSFDSKSSYSTNQEVRQVQVQVQINSVSLRNYPDQSEHSVSESSQTREFNNDNIGSNAYDFEGNDDDDVIVR